MDTAVEQERGQEKNGKQNLVLSRVCSIHFLDGSPTTANPNPTLYLGYALFAFPPVGQQTTNYKKRNYIISKLHVTETVLAEYQPTNDHRDIAADHRYSLPDNNFEKCDILMSHLTHFILKLVQTSCSQFLIISSNQSVSIKK